MWFLYTALVGAVITGLMMLWSRVQRATASSQRAAIRRDNRASQFATESDLALRYAGSPFDHVGMRQVHDLRRHFRQGVPVTSFTFRFLADNNAAMADLSWRSYDVITVRLPVRLPTLKVTTKPMFHTSRHDGPLTRPGSRRRKHSHGSSRTTRHWPGPVNTTSSTSTASHNSCCRWSAACRT